MCAARSRLHLPTLSYLSPSHLVLKRHSPVTGVSHPTLKVLVITLLTLSGACIPLANKCNSKIDCFEDESDESHCSYLEVFHFQKNTFILQPNIFPGATKLCRPAESSVNWQRSCSGFHQCLNSCIPCVRYLSRVLHWV